MKIKSLFSDQELLQKIAMGDERAFRLIFDRYHKKVYLFALRILNSELLAEEVLQEVMLKIWQKSDDLTGILNFESYLRTVSRNHCYNIFRKIQSEAKNLMTAQKDWIESHNETEDEIMMNELRGILQQGINSLPHQQRLVYQLCHQEGLKYEEAAQRLNLSPLTVKSYMKLALRFLRNYLNKHTDVVVILTILKLL